MNFNPSYLPPGYISPYRPNYSSSRTVNPYNYYSDAQSAAYYAYSPQFPYNNNNYNPLFNYAYPPTMYPAYDPTLPMTNNYYNLPPAPSVTPTTPPKVTNTPISSPQIANAASSSGEVDSQTLQNSTAPVTVSSPATSAQSNQTEASAASNETASAPAMSQSSTDVVAPNSPSSGNASGNPLAEGDLSSINTSPLITTNGETGSDINSLPPQVKDFIEMIPEILKMPESPQFSGEQIPQSPKPSSSPSGRPTLKLPSHKRQKLLPFSKRRKYNPYYSQECNEYYP